MSETGTIETSAPTNAPTNSSSSESQWLQESASKTLNTPPNDAKTAKPVETKDPSGQILPTDTPEQAQEQTDAETPQEWTIKDWEGKDKVVSLEWMQKYFNVSPELAPFVNKDNMPLLQHIAEKSLKVNNAYQRAKMIEPEYNSYKESVQQYFDYIASDPVTGFNKIMTDLGLDDKAQEALIEKMAIQLIEKREMSPEQRAAMEAQKERDRIMQEAQTYKQQLEEMKIQQQAQQLAPTYTQSITNALTSVGFDTSPAVWDAIVSNALARYGNQAEPITQAQFTQIAQEMALQAMSFKKQAQPQQTQAQPVKKVIQGKNYNGKPSVKPQVTGFETEQEWLAKQGLKTR